MEGEKSGFAGKGTRGRVSAARNRQNADRRRASKGKSFPTYSHRMANKYFANFCAQKSTLRAAVISKGLQGFSPPAAHFTNHLLAPYGGFRCSRSSFR
jgi:hypothetical protein